MVITDIAINNVTLIIRTLDFMVPAGSDNQGCTVLRMWLIPVHSQYWDWPHSQSGAISKY